MQIQGSTEPQRDKEVNICGVEQDACGAIQVSESSCYTSGHALSRYPHDIRNFRGYCLLSAIGKTVFRPGGPGLTSELIRQLDINSRDTIVDIGVTTPGGRLSLTTREILAYKPARYIAICHSTKHAKQLAVLLTSHHNSSTDKVIASGHTHQLPLADAAMDKLLSEAIMVKQPDEIRRRTLAEIARVLRPGGKFATHEICITDDTPRHIAQRIQEKIYRAIPAPISYLYARQWVELIEGFGFKVQKLILKPIVFILPHRVIGDETLHGTLKIVYNMVTKPRDGANTLRVLSTIATHWRHMRAIGIVAVKK